MFIEPETEYRNFLRSQLTDYNSGARGGSQWVYDDWPRKDLNEAASYPRVVVTKISESGDMIGLADNDTWDDVVLDVEVIVHRDTGVMTVTNTDEAVGVIANSPRISLNRPAASVTNVKHNSTPFGVVNAVVNDDDFTSPSAGTVEWSRSTGNLNFNATDLSNYSGQSITSTYVEKLEGENLARRIARDAARLTRSNWRTDEQLGGLTQPSKIGGPEIRNFNEARGWHRAGIEYSFKRYNTGEET